MCTSARRRTSSQRRAIRSTMERRFSISQVHAAHAATNGGDRATSLASRRRFCAIAASMNSNCAPRGPRKRRRPSRKMRFKCAYSISTRFLSRRTVGTDAGVVAPSPTRMRANIKPRPIIGRVDRRHCSDAAHCTNAIFFQSVCVPLRLVGRQPPPTAKWIVWPGVKDCARTRSGRSDHAPKRGKPLGGGRPPAAPNAVP
jgi:hypothetical protein